MWVVTAIDVFATDSKHGSLGNWIAEFGRARFWVGTLSYRVENQHYDHYLFIKFFGPIGITMIDIHLCIG